MTVYTIYAKSNDWSLRSSNATWTTARSGGGTFTQLVAQTFATFGCNPGYGVDQAFLEFDLSSVPADVPNSMSLNLTTVQVGSALGVSARETTFTVANGDWIPGADLTSKTLFGTGTTPTGQDELITISSTINPSRSSSYQLVVYTTALESGTAPGTLENRSFRASEYSGTSSDPYITMDVTRKVAAETGVFTLSGQAAAAQLTVVHAVGAFTFTGNDATLTFGWSPLIGGAGAFILSGQAVSFIIKRAPPDTRTFTWSISSIDDTRTFSF